MMKEFEIFDSLNRRELIRNGDKLNVLNEVLKDATRELLLGEENKVIEPKNYDEKKYINK